MIIVDDGSTDATLELLKSLAGQGWSQPSPRVSAEEVGCDAHGFIWPESAPGFDTAFLELIVNADSFGAVFDPWVEIGARKSGRQYFERSARGTRYLNVSQVLSHGIKPGDRVKLRGRHVAWSAPAARMILFKNPPLLAEGLLVAAPHPDDAEIAAYGIYSTRDSTLVTMTAGDASNYDYRPIIPKRELHPAWSARLRVWDSLFVGAIGGVSPLRAVNLCYWDGRLADMFGEPDRDFTLNGPPGADFVKLRQQNFSPLLTEANVKCSWNSLVADLAHLLRQTRPTAIATPYPYHDNHPDHDLTTIALCQAMRQAGLTEGRLLLYMNHCRHTELHPFGPAGSLSSLPPHFGEGIRFRSIYAHSLTVEKQQEKFFALEAMHDMRYLPWLHTPSWHALLTLFRAEIHAKLHGLGRPPTSHFRRGVRSHELFFVVPFSEAGLLVEEYFTYQRTMGRNTPGAVMPAVFRC